MSSTARISKTFKPPAPGKGRFHREHRSKKGRGYHPEIIFTRDRKRKMEKLVAEELDREA